MKLPALALILATGCAAPAAIAPINGQAVAPTLPVSVAAVPTGRTDRWCIPVFADPRTERKAIASISIDEKLTSLGFIPEDRHGDPWLCSSRFHSSSAGYVTLTYVDGTAESIHFTRYIIE